MQLKVPTCSLNKQFGIYIQSFLLLLLAHTSSLTFSSLREQEPLQQEITTSLCYLLQQRTQHKPMVLSKPYACWKHTASNGNRVGASSMVAGSHFCQRVVPGELSGGSFLLRAAWFHLLMLKGKESTGQSKEDTHSVNTSTETQRNVTQHCRTGVRL